MFKFHIHTQFHQFYYIHFLLCFRLHVLFSILQTIFCHVVLQPPLKAAVFLKSPCFDRFCCLAHCGPPTVLVPDYCPTHQTKCSWCFCVNWQVKVVIDIYSSLCREISAKGSRLRAKAERQEHKKRKRDYLMIFLGTQEEIASGIMALCTESL